MRTRHSGDELSGLRPVVDLRAVIDTEDMHGVGVFPGPVGTAPGTVAAGKGPGQRRAGAST
jgi:hypothetical protein